MKRTQLTTAILAAALVALLSSDLAAQEEGRRGRRGGQGGPGGRGGDPTLGLLRTDRVKAELEISDEQQTALEKLADQRRERSAGEKRPNFREMSEEERNEFIAKMRKRQVERSIEIREQLEEVLLPAQMERLEQIVLQAQGAVALENPDVREALKITEDQISKLNEARQSIQTTMREKMQQLFQSSDRDGMREAFGKLRSEAEQKLFEVLTEDQRSQLEKMKGEPFDLPAPGFRRGGRSSGPGGPGRPGGERRRRGRPESGNE